MKFAENFKIVGNSLTLIPYKPAHVPKYHSWMSNEEILRLTGSERLSLQEEYEMQQEWERDHKSELAYAHMVYYDKLIN